jgi:protein transport protein SEC61 subunit gamma-like protein
MDSNQAQSGESPNKEQQPQQSAPEQKPESRFAQMAKSMEGKKFYMPKLQMPNLREKFTEYGRVMKVTKKPDSQEFRTIVKASGLGITIIGVLGFIIALIFQVIEML